MKILLSNDDGVDSLGLSALVGAFAGAHSVWVAAPDKQQSAVSRAMTLYAPLRAVRYTLQDFREVEAYAVSGTPVDCVRLALGNLLPRPDAMLSGINIGPNLGTDTLYSGTCAAAQEAAVRGGFPALAISIASFTPKYLDTAAAVAKRALDWAVKHPLPFGAFYNVNVPDLPLGQIRGARRTGLALVEYQAKYEERLDPIGRKYYWAPRELVTERMGQDSDARWIAEGYVTVTALSYDGAVDWESGEIAF